MRREDVPIDEPCDASWQAMQGDDRRRHCDHCDRDVVNLSQMTEREAEAFLADHHAPCVRYHVTADDEIVFRDPQVTRQQTGARELLGAAALVAPLLVVGAGCEAGAETDADRPAARSTTPAAEVDWESSVDADDLEPVEALEQTGEYLTAAAERTRANLRTAHRSFEDLARGAAASPTDRRAKATPSEDEPEPDPIVRRSRSDNDDDGKDGTTLMGGAPGSGSIHDDSHDDSSLEGKIDLF